MNETTRVQQRLIGEVFNTLAEAGPLRCWLFGGWGLDARIGRATRDHSDVEFWADRVDADRIRDALVAVGATVLDTQPAEESYEFVKDGVMFSIAFFDRQPDGTCTPQGRWSDWIFPADTFDAPPGHLDGLPVPTMSVEGMIAMKEQFATLRNGRPLRDKDMRDLSMLRQLVREGS
jgi:hypothetical protein